MKKIFAIVALWIVVLAAVNSIAWAADAVDVDKISTTITIRNDWYSPNEGAPFDLQWYTAYVHYRNFGGGVDINVNRSTDYTRVRPFMTFNSGPWYVLAGAAYSNLDQFARAGIAYIGSLGSFRVVADWNLYVGLDQDSNTYLDTFWSITHRLGQNFFAGLEVVYDHWWEGPSHDFLLGGPVIGYNFPKDSALSGLSVFARWSHEGHFWGDKIVELNAVRLGVRYNF